MLYLDVASPQGERRIELTEFNTIGRNSKNNIHFPDLSLSKEHAVLFVDCNGDCILHDLKSKNGTFVNGARIRKAKLRDGDEITLGNVKSFFKTDGESALEMVELKEDDGFSQTTSFTTTEDRFLPEIEIRNENMLRTDYEKLRVTYELHRDIRLDTDVKVVLGKILDRMAEFLKYDQAVILLRSKDGKMIPRSYRDFKQKRKFIISSTLVRYVTTEKNGIISTDIEMDERFNIAESIALQGMKSTIATPIMIGNDVIGVMILCSLEQTHAFTEKDLGLITSIANQAAQIIQNSLLHDELRLSFESAMRTLSATVDARHPLTAGHSERVTDYSLFIAREMRLSETEIENLKFAALLHDIGKIGIEDAILLKDGEFTSDERAVMNTHPEKTKKILQTFHFPDNLSAVPEYASYHHEKVNGEGYPHQLTGEQLPLISKIIAVADVFDALTNHRDYPKYIGDKRCSYNPLPIFEVVSLMNREAGHHFDPEVVAAFIRCLPQILYHYKGMHFSSEYVEAAVRLLCGLEN